MKTRILALVTWLIAGWGTSSVHAGILGITYQDVSPTATIDLSAPGTLDWAKWGNGEPTDTLNYSTPRQTGGSIIDTALTPLGSSPPGTAVTLETFAPIPGENPYFTWNNGTIPMAGGNPVGTSVGETILPAQFSYPIGLGLSLQAAADAAPRTLELYVYGFNARMELTASMSGGGSESLLASNATLYKIAAANNNYFSYGIFSITYAGAGQTLTVDLTAANQSGIPTNAPQYVYRNAGVYAATVIPGAVPEPSSIVLSVLGLGGVICCAVVRRRNRSNGVLD